MFLNSLLSIGGNPGQDRPPHGTPPKPPVPPQPQPPDPDDQGEDEK